MHLYIQIIKFSFLRFFTYPVEMIANILKRTTSTGFYIALWIAISYSGAQVNLNELIPYYFIASGIAEINMSYFGLFGRKLGMLIKEGGINTIIIKPVNILMYVYANALGESGMRIMTGLVMIILGLILNKHLQLIQILYFFLFLILSISVAFAFNAIEGIVFFYVPEAGGFRSTINHIKNLLSGLMVPLYMFPEFLKNILIYSPFATLIYYPSLALSSKLEPNDILIKLVVGTIWSLIINALVFAWWVRSLKRYEGVGI